MHINLFVLVLLGLVIIARPRSTPRHSALLPRHGFSLPPPPHATHTPGGADWARIGRGRGADSAAGVRRVCGPCGEGAEGMWRWC